MVCVATGFDSSATSVEESEESCSIAEPLELILMTEAFEEIGSCPAGLVALAGVMSLDVVAVASAVVDAETGCP